MNPQDIIKMIAELSKIHAQVEIVDIDFMKRIILYRCHYYDDSFNSKKLEMYSKSF